MRVDDRSDDEIDDMPVRRKLALIGPDFEVRHTLPVVEMKKMWAY